MIFMDWVDVDDCKISIFFSIIFFSILCDVSFKIIESKLEKF